MTEYKKEAPHEESKNKIEKYLAEIIRWNERLYGKIDDPHCCAEIYRDGILENVREVWDLVPEEKE